ncbi:unnamed protein product, partial [marine sediment metagenome]
YQMKARVRNRNELGPGKEEKPREQPGQPRMLMRMCIMILMGGVTPEEQ